MNADATPCLLALHVYYCNDLILEYIHGVFTDVCYPQDARTKSDVTLSSFKQVAQTHRWNI